MTSVASNETFTWYVGLQTSRWKYLTAESFGGNVNVSGTTLRRKQTWCLEILLGSTQRAALRSYNGSYLSTDRAGVVVCNKDTSDDDCWFSYEFLSGRLTLRSKHNVYLSSAGDLVQCDRMRVDEFCHWTIQLAIHPQVNLKSPSRRGVLYMDLDKLRIKGGRPWGDSHTITLEYNEGLTYIKAVNGRYLTWDGQLVDIRENGCAFILELLGKCVRFKHPDSNRSLTPFGPMGIVQLSREDASSTSTSKEDVFQIVNRQPEISLLRSNGKYVSIKQGVHLTANQSDVEATEVFKLECAGASQFVLRCSTNNLWSYDDPQGILGVGVEEDRCRFEIDWLGQNQISLRACSGRYVAAKPNGSLILSSDASANREIFNMELRNRQNYIFRCEYGFLGVRPGSDRIDCGRSVADPFQLQLHNGWYKIINSNGLNWAESNDNYLCLDAQKWTRFCLRILDDSHIEIRDDNGKFLTATQSGPVVLTSDHAATFLWEF